MVSNSPGQLETEGAFDNFLINGEAFLKIPCFNIQLSRASPGGKPQASDFNTHYFSNQKSPIRNPSYAKASAGRR